MLTLSLLALVIKSMLLPLYEASIASALPTTILNGFSTSTSKLSPYLNNLLTINLSYAYISIQHSSKKLRRSLFETLIEGLSLFMIAGVSIKLSKLVASSILFVSILVKVSFADHGSLLSASLGKPIFI